MARFPIPMAQEPHDPVGFTGADLSTLQIKQGTRAVTHLQALALQSGFKLSARDPISSKVPRLDGRRSECSKGHNNTTKTNCPFHLKLRWRANEKADLVVGSLA
jgi:hypothetical protein